MYHQLLFHIAALSATVATIYYTYGCLVASHVQYRIIPQLGSYASPILNLSVALVPGIGLGHGLDIDVVSVT